MRNNQRLADKTGQLVTFYEEKEEYLHIQENHKDIKRFIEEIEHFLKK